MNNYNQLALNVKNSVDQSRKYFFSKMLLFKDECYKFIVNNWANNDSEKNKAINRIINDPQYAILLLSRRGTLTEKQKEIAIKMLLLDFGCLIEFLKLPCKINDNELWYKYRLKAIEKLVLFEEEIVDTLSKKKFYNDNYNFIQYNFKEIEYIWNNMKYCRGHKYITYNIFTNQNMTQNLRVEIFSHLINDFEKIKKLIEDNFKFNNEEKELIYYKYFNILLYDKYQITSFMLEIINTFQQYLKDSDYKNIYEKYKSVKYVGFLKKMMKFNFSQNLKDEIESFLIMCKLNRG